MVPSGRSRFRPMSWRTKSWIKRMRVVQLCLRVLEAVAAVGLVVVMSLAGLIGWIMGVTLGVVILHCLYSIYHHARPAGSRTPGSSAAYHVFSGISDLCALPLYAYGAITTRNKSEEWETTDLAKTNVMKFMVPSVYYGLIAAGGLHLLSLAISLWLGVMFRRISMMPPDMNPLEANLTSRAHKRNKSSVATTSTYSDEKPESQLYDEHSRPPSIPFMHTRQGSEASFDSHDSRLNLPSRQYQITPSNRSSTSSHNLKRMSAPPAASRGSYTDIPLGETGASHSRPISMYSAGEGRPSSGSVASSRPEPVAATQTAQPRSAKFTETWYASESLINRTQQRNRASNMTNPSPTKRGSNYESLRQTLDASDSEDENTNTYHYSYNQPASPGLGTDNGESAHHLPNPLRSHPTSTTTITTTTKQPPSQAPTTPRRPRTPFSRLRASVLSEISLNDRRVSGSQDITDARQHPRNRTSSIQPDADFSLRDYSKPYGELKATTPPIIVGGGARQVSTGNDYDLGSSAAAAAGGLGRRHVSGKVAEEGLADGGRGWGRSRYSVF
ncbi:uncharacterized protein THITE_2115055, partial [Thermothielavioides terrestris NRRL 8126]